MANAVQKITLATSRDIPFNRLLLSQSNVRRVKAGISVEELAESIARRGLIQSLHVRPVIGDDGTETGMFEVPAGGRRFRALELLVKRKKLAKTTPVPCIVSDPDADILIDELSLAENIERAPLHPLDQFRAFLALRAKGMTEEAIAAAFFVDVRVVRQRLRLASVAPALLEIYAEDGMVLEQLMAFTVTEDHARQEQVWEAIKDDWAREPWHIRRMLTETTVPASDKRAGFVGIDAYEAAGGYVLRDLFQQDEGGWLQDTVLLDKLVGERLKAEAEAIAAEGWKWIEVAVSFPYGHDHGLRELVGTTVDLTEAEYATREALRDEYDQLEARHASDDELPDEADRRLGEIEEALEAFERRPVIYDPAEIARAGVFICIDGDGSPLIERGFVRPEDEAGTDGEGEGGDGSGCEMPEGTEPGNHQHTLITVGGEPEEEDDGSDVIKPLPDRLVIELTAHRTLALRDALASNPRVAVTALLHRLVRACFGLPASGCALEARVHDVHLPVQSPELGDSLSAQAIEDRHETWNRDLPLAQGDDRLWDRLDQLDEASRQALLAHCLSFGINALYERPNPYSGSGVNQQGLDRRMHEADRLARATGLDLVEAGWRPTVGNYLGRVTKARIVEAVREGVGDHAAELIEGLKKDKMAQEAERLLAGTGWLPEPLRPPMDADAMDDPSGQDGDSVALPDFLAGDDEGSEAQTDELATVAAE